MSAALACQSLLSGGVEAVTKARKEAAELTQGANDEMQAAVHSLDPSLPPSLTHSLTPSLPPSLTPSLTHSLTHIDLLGQKMRRYGLTAESSTIRGNECHSESINLRQRSIDAVV